jgi:LysR family transcriptional regulator, low CO2-responsive transcriptional regulator
VGNRAETVNQLANQDIDLAVMGRPPTELKTSSVAFARHPMAFVAAPAHPLMSGGTQRIELAALNDANLLVRERGSGTRTTVEQLFKDAGLSLVIGSEMSSNEAIKQMCAAGFGVAFLSLHACALELQAQRLAVLPMAVHPVEREWHVIHLTGRKLPAAAAAFEQFLRRRGQEWIDAQWPVAHRADRTETLNAVPPRGARRRAASGSAPRVS